jgi:hypothetical protein
MSDQVVQALADLRAEVSALRDELRTARGSDKRIEPDGIYSIDEATAKLPISASTLRKKLRARIIAGKGGSRGRPWQIRGAELLKLAD